MLQFDGFGKQLVVPVPLNKVRSTHESAVLAGAAVIVPQIEVSEIDGLGKWWSSQCAVLMQPIHDVFRSKHSCIRVCDNLLCLRVDAIDAVLCMALRADLLHVDLRLQVVGTVGTDSVSKVPAKAVRGVMSYFEPVDAAHVAGSAGGNKHVARGKRAGIGIQMQKIALRREHDAMLGFVVDLDLRMVWPHVALPTSGWQPG